MCHEILDPSFFHDFKPSWPLINRPIHFRICFEIAEIFDHQVQQILTAEILKIFNISLKLKPNSKIVTKLLRGPDGNGSRKN